MAGTRELGFLKPSVCSLREQLARTTLRNVILQGHTYVELREEGKRFIFFCTLCLAPCYSDAVLFDHLKGNLHSERLAAAKATLLKPNPWPFSDGVLFFQGSSEEHKQLPIDELAIVCHGENLNRTAEGNISPDGYSSGGDADYDSSSPNKHGRDTNSNDSLSGSCTKGNGRTYDLVVPGVLREDEICDLKVRFVGVGQIAARFLLKDEVPKGIFKLWCEWLGKNQNMDAPTIPEHDFAVITFSYSCGLGRKGLLDDVRYLLSPRNHEEIEDVDGAIKKRRKSFSDPEDTSESLCSHYDSSGEDSQSSISSTSRMLLHGFDDQLLHSRFISSKSMRKELRRQHRIAAERMCDICQQKMLPGKDVATLLNRKTGRLVCSSRNGNGAFHLFHTSCLIHWVLLCESEIYAKQLVSPKVKRRSKRKSGAKCKRASEEGEIEPSRKQIYCVFCPECQGAGINMDGDELEKPTVSLSEMFRFKIKVSDARRAWMKSPEVLQNCSTGFCFSSQSDEMVQENVSPLKLLHFYRVEG